MRAGGEAGSSATARALFRQMSVAPVGLDAGGHAGPRIAAVPAVEVDDLRRRFGSVEALRGVSLEVGSGEIHALLGPNGAGKTTLMRVLCGLLEPSGGSAYVLDRRAGRSRELRELIGLVPSGDRSFYLRLSGLENLAFFARMHGLRRRAADERAAELLRSVGLSEAARRPVNTYSHGMQKRLSFARALLHTPGVLLVDEATHDLDPVAAEQVRALTRDCALNGTAIVWATQRIEELAGFADRVTVLDRGSVCFAGTVAALAAAGGGDRHIVGLGPRTTAELPALDAALGTRGRVQPASDAAHAVVTLAPGVSLGAALAALTAAGAEVTSCRDERPPIERAFLAVTAETPGRH
jgi:ABC-2 type transport system ATP-binding protein